MEQLLPAFLLALDPGQLSAQRVVHQVARYLVPVGDVMPLEVDVEMMGRPSGVMMVVSPPSITCLFLSYGRTSKNKSR
jgi:hypothetical protein